MSRDSAVMIVGVFEKQVSKKISLKIFKIVKKIKIDFNDVIDPSDDVFTFGTKFLKNFGGGLPSCKKSSL